MCNYLLAYPLVSAHINPTTKRTIIDNSRLTSLGELGWKVTLTCSGWTDFEVRVIDLLSWRSAGLSLLEGICNLRLFYHPRPWHSIIGFTNLNKTSNRWDADDLFHLLEGDC